jgi:hypothetical protein
VLFNIKIKRDAGWSSLVARRAHNPKVGGSNPSPATIKNLIFLTGDGVFLFIKETRTLLSDYL